MKKKLYIAIASLLAVLMAVLPFINAKLASADNAAVGPEGFAATSKAALLMDADTGEVVFGKNTKDRLPIASMVKIMTLSVAFDEMEKRGISPDTQVTASETAASMGGSQAFLDANASYALGELLKSIVVASANDSCVAVAEYLFGSVDAFVAEMNARANEWGMSDTAFTNCTGLPKAGQYCCADDVAVMFKKLISHERFFEYAGEWLYDFRHPDGRITQLTNTNKLVRFYDGCDGGKTGYTDAAGSCITVTAKRGETRLICVAIGAENSKTRNKEVSELLNYGFANYKTLYAVHKGDVIGEYEVSGGKTSTVTAVAADDVKLFTKIGASADIALEPDIKPLCAPIAAGDRVGELTVKVGGKAYASVDALAATDCMKKGYLDIVDDFVENW